MEIVVNLRKSIDPAGALLAACLSFNLLAVDVARADDLPLVTIGTTDASDETIRHWKFVALHRKLVLRFTQEGFGVVPQNREHDVAVSLTATQDGVLITVRAHGQNDSRHVPAAKQVSQTHLEVIQHTLSMTRAMAGKRPAASQTVEPPATIEAAAPAWWTELELGMGSQWRGDGFSPSGAVAVSTGPSRSWGARAGLGLTSMHSGRLDVIETTVLAGLTWRMAEPGQRWQAQLALSGGVALLSYRLGGEPGAPVAHRWDALASLLLQSSWVIAETTRVGLWLKPAWLPRSRDIRRGERTVWRSQRYRVLGGLSLVWRISAWR